MSLQIRKTGWVDELRAISAHLGDDFWSDFTPCSAAVLRRLQDEIGRALPEDFAPPFRPSPFELRTRLLRFPSLA